MFLRRDYPRKSAWKKALYIFKENLVTKGGKYAFDFLATFDLTESGPIASAGGLFGDSTPLSTLTVGDVVFDALAIPDDPTIPQTTY